ncbi:hypothetical protein LINPERHAP1_LOCUS34974 [Linum perenne]
MEVEGDDGSKIDLHYGSESVFGRGSGFTTEDITVSRRHIILHLDGENQGQPPRVSFEVIGTNPVWVQTGGEVKTFKKLEKGELQPGDCFCISSRPPVWFRLKPVIQSQAGVEDVDASQLDKLGFVVDFGPENAEFGFVVIGREFERYLKGRVRDAKEWDWFLEEAGEDEDEEGRAEKGRSHGNRKKRKGTDEEEDEEWTGEAEEEGNSRGKLKVGGAKYVTRSKQGKGEKKGKKKEDGEDEEDDGDDETLGGFIVDEEELAEEDEEEEEEEELMEDEDDDED